MSGRALTKDTQCRSLGFVDNPPRGYFRSLKTCSNAKKAKPIAFALVLSRDVYNGGPDLSPAVPDTPRSPAGPRVDDLTSSCNIESVEFLTIDNGDSSVQGIYKVNYKPGTFTETPVVHVTPCESFTLGDFSTNFPTEQSIMFCQASTPEYAVVITGRFRLRDLGGGPPARLAPNVSFHFSAMARV